MTIPRPYTLIAELTYRCPLRCLYCSNPVAYAQMKEELTTEQWMRTFSDAADLGVVQVHLSGGEPAVRDDLEALISHARACELYSNLITGGTVLDEAILARFKAAGLDHVQLSIQDTDRQAAELVAGLRSYEKKIEIARAVKRLGLPLTLNVVLHRFNLERVPDLIAHAADLGAERLELASTQYYAWALENRGALMPSRAECEAAEAVVIAARERHRGRMEIAFVMPDYYSDQPKACMGGWAKTYMLVTPIGEVLPCHAAHVIPGLRFESVKQRPLGEIWGSSQALNAFRGDDWMQEPCKSCPRKTIDFGGCRCQAFLLAGEAAAADPVCSLSPRHEVVVKATDCAATVSESGLVYRDKKNSLRLASGSPLPSP